ncbi:methyl-accepting chemotaxis protein, partial [Methylobacterium sp. E-066]|uniref:HAMP domain-containing methyl-accepting chemotaxis protein n=1 Tax=Methylobacterium sp. E-066 TaxID=2836584 RepID=UPI001FB878BD
MRFTIRAKLALSFGLILVLLGGAGYLAIASLGASNERMQAFATGPFAQVQRVLRVETMAVEAARIMNRTLLEPTDAGRAQLTLDFKAQDGRFRALLAEFIDRASPEERARIKTLQDHWNKLNEIAAKSLELSAKNGNNNAIAIAGNEQMAAYGAVMARIEELAARPDLSVENRRLVDAIELRVTRLLAEIYREVMISDDAMLAKFASEYQEHRRQLNQDLVRLTEAGRADGFLDGVKAIAAAVKTWEPIGERIFTLGLANTDAKALLIIVGPFTQARAAVTDEAAKLRAYEEDVAQNFVRDTQAAYETTRLLLVGVIAGAVAIGLAMAIWLSLSISRGLNRAVDAASRVAEGDLKQDVVASSRDEIGDLLRAVQAMNLKLREVVGQVILASSNVSAGSQELSSSAEQLSQGSTEQAASTEEASASMEEMAANVKQNAENASQTEAIARQSAKDAEASGVAVGQAVDAMQTIAQKITIVQEIARQT